MPEFNIEYAFTSQILKGVRKRLFLRSADLQVGV